MDTAELVRRASADTEPAREPEAPAAASTRVENVLSLQRSAGNASVSRLLGASRRTASTRQRGDLCPEDNALSRSLARAASARNGVKEADPGAEAEVAALDAEQEPDEVEEEELEDSEAAEAAPSGAAAPTAAGAKLARKTKAPPVPKIKAKTKFKAPTGGRTRDTVAVGEKVTFTGNKPGAWTASGGLPVTQGAGKTFVWSAPDRAASVTVKLTIGALSDTKTVTVVEPTSITATKVGSDMTFPGGTQGAGMKLRFKYHPLNVSFGNIFVKEVSGPATNFSGYFPHPPNNQHWHNSGDVFTRIREDNTDSAIDTASFRGYPSPWTDGGFEWVIPNNFRTVTEAGDGKQFTTVTQVFKIEGPPNAGRSTVSKAGQSAPRSP